MINKNNVGHWQRIFTKTAVENLGWYEQDLTATIRLLEQIPNWRDAKIFIPGVGATQLANYLVVNGVNLVVNDISQDALSIIKKSISQKYHKKITYINQSIIEPITNVYDIDIWLDRAVLHFFTNIYDINNYLNNVRLLTKIGSFVIIAEFAKTGVKKCAGLPLKLYDKNSLVELLTSDFELITSFDYDFINPRGEIRPYIYTLFKRIR